MKKTLSFVTALALIFTVMPVREAHAAGFSFYRAITIDHTKVPNTDQVNFPVVVSGTYTYLKTTGNGGNVQNASGYDVGFYTSSNCSTGKLNWETERYIATTGEVDYWVKIASLSHTTDTVIYMCYGNSAITTDQSSATSVWDGNYVLVYHLPDGTTLGANDSTVNALNGTNSSATAGTGQVAGGAVMSGSSQYVSTAFFGPPSSITIEAWVKPSSAGGVVFTEQNGGWHDSQLEVETNNIVKACMWTGGLTCVNATTTLAYGSWSLLAMRYSATSTTLAGLANGSIGASTVATKQYPGSDSYGIGQADSTNGGNGNSLTGSVDEVRVSNIARSDDWIATEYNNQSSPSTFYSVGSQQSFGGSGTGSSAVFRLLGGVLRVIGGKIFFR